MFTFILYEFDAILKNSSLITVAVSIHNNSYFNHPILHKNPLAQETIRKFIKISDLNISDVKNIMSYF